MTIDKLEEFAVNGDKSITGLNLTTGFPRQQKPFRQWMNYLFNWSAVKTNEIIDLVNGLELKVAILSKPIAVGELFITTNEYTTAAQVAARHGYGTWQRFAEGRTLVGYSSTTANGEQYRIMGNQFGANTHKLTVAEMPNHEHTLVNSGNSLVDSEISNGWKDDIIPGSIISKPLSYSGDGVPDKCFLQKTKPLSHVQQAHNNIQPSIVVAYWLRTA